jgi:hypothetical protein
MASCGSVGRGTACGFVSDGVWAPLPIYLISRLVSFLTPLTRSLNGWLVGSVLLHRSLHILVLDRWEALCIICHEQQGSKSM